MNRIESFLLSNLKLNRVIPIQLDITNACNLKCIHCYHPHHNNEGALSLASWVQILEQYESMRQKLHFIPKLILCGGEPTLSPHFEPLIKWAIERNYPVAVLSNGTTVQRLNRELLKQKKHLEFQISLDGPTAQLHDAYRGAGMFLKAQKGTKLLKDHGINVKLLAILSKNTSEHLPEFFETAKAWQVDAMNFTRLIGEGQAIQMIAAQKDRALNPLELKNAYQSIIRLSAETRVSSNTTSPLMHLLHPVLGSQGRFADGMVVDYQGNLLASSRSRIILGGVFTEGLENLFLNHPILVSVRKGRVKSCGSCPDFNRCGGDRNAAYAAYGDYLAQDPGCWKTFAQSA